MVYYLPNPVSKQIFQAKGVALAFVKMMLTPKLPANARYVSLHGPRGGYLKHEKPLNEKRHGPRRTPCRSALTLVPKWRPPTPLW
jgi:hypothetical protein